LIRDIIPFFNCDGITSKKVQKSSDSFFEKIQNYIPKHSKLFTISKLKLLDFFTLVCSTHHAEGHVDPKVLARACRFIKHQIENRLWLLLLPTFFKM
jgi:hypothetical protein